jgi:hypothetical protein
MAVIWAMAAGLLAWHRLTEDGQAVCFRMEEGKQVGCDLKRPGRKVTKSETPDYDHLCGACLTRLKPERDQLLKQLRFDEPIPRILTIHNPDHHRGPYPQEETLYTCPHCEHVQEQPEDCQECGKDMRYTPEEEKQRALEIATHWGAKKGRD